MRIPIYNLLKTCVFVGFLFVPFFQSQSQNAVKPIERIAIRVARLIDGKSDELVNNAVIVVEGRKITAVAGGWRFP
jgi:hypothetical protein